MSHIHGPEDTDLHDDHDDAVARFFADEREAVRPVPADPERWAQITEGASQPRRRPWWGAAAGVAAAVAIGLTGWSLQQTPFGHDDVSRGSAVSGKPVPTVSRLSTRGVQAPVSESQQPRPVPASFHTWSLSNAGSGTLFALGSGPCANGFCPAVLSSADEGASWTMVHSFAQTDTTRSQGTAQSPVQPERAITEVRFATPQIGYVFGGDLWMTKDGGVSFDRLAHPGQTVLDVEVDAGKDVVVLSADGCSATGCVGPLYLSRASAKGDEALTTTTQLELDTPVQDAQLVLRKGQVYVQPTATSAETARPLRLQSGGLTAIPQPKECGASPLQALTSAADNSGVLYAGCSVSVQGGTTAYRVLRSNDHGATWQSTPTQVNVPSSGRLSLAVPRPDHVVVTTGGPRPGSAGGAIKQRLQVTADGGRTWQLPTTPGALPEQGFDWTASPGGGQVYAVPRTAKGYWRSSTDGRTWTVVDPTASSSKSGGPATSSTR
ncbi:sialidase family protein [Luteipulveratus mongoliensis]|uniref:Sialidase domain-containing protein n=1 Tax=Luteipulveratus mongoliensis TaxID=571913 RepID=A0A0K1JK56_9MICO|nr:sialidase family protein [Luteipulveratus mongoliensis]AKU17086.1 hypothetical protein VV02_16485 [Luteipulveratus mongoliensis]